MCTGPELALLFVSTASTVMAASAQADAADAQATQAANEGEYRRDAAKAQAERIRRAGRSQRSAAQAALAGSGVKLGEGTALEVDKQIATDSEKDALSAILSGDRAYASGKAEASALSSYGESQQIGGYMSAAGNVLGSYQKTGWKQPTKNGG